MKTTLKNALSKTQETSTKEIEQILSKKIENSSSLLDFGQLWNSHSFGIDNLTGFQKASGAVQKEILKELALNRFLEAYNIEKAGMSFSAKMSLLAQSLNEQKLYSLFSAEEATHFHYIQGALNFSGVDYSADPFINLLNEIIISGERRPLIFIIQVILEGWGIDHYSIMEKSCLNPEVKEHLKLILQDEASHHGSGLSLFHEGDLTEQEFNYTLDMMVSFLEMVNCGPVGTVNCLQKFIPELNIENSLQEMGAHVETKRKLEFIRNLMIKAKSKKLLAKLDSKKLFETNFSF